jgi:hypothetical protein
MPRAAMSARTKRAHQSAFQGRTATSSIHGIISGGFNALDA